MLFRDLLKSSDLMHHQIEVEDVPQRLTWLRGLCSDKSVLHVGCCDVPVFDPNNNLHIELSQVSNQIDGLDISLPGIDVLKKHVFGNYYHETKGIKQGYDLVLAPEVLEHTPNAHEFLDQLFQVKAKSYLITAPHIQWYERTRREGSLFIEEVHEDHRAWYSPYTLLNIVRPFIKESSDDVKVFIMAGIGSVAVLITKDQRPPLGRPDETAIPYHELPNKQRIEKLLSTNYLAEALYLLRKSPEQKKLQGESYFLLARTLLKAGRGMDALRLSVEFMQSHPQDPRCLRLAETAARSLNQEEAAREFAALAHKYE